MRREHNYSPSGGSRRKKAIKVSKESKVLLTKLSKRLVNKFKSRAKELGLRVKLGSHGNIPTVASAVELTVSLWETLPEEEKITHITKHVDTICQRLMEANNG